MLSFPAVLRCRKNAAKYWRNCAGMTRGDTRGIEASPSSGSDASRVSGCSIAALTPTFAWRVPRTRYRSVGSDRERMSTSSGFYPSELNRFADADEEHRNENNILATSSPHATRIGLFSSYSAVV